jgi:hypothetical protein
MSVKTYDPYPLYRPVSYSETRQESEERPRTIMPKCASHLRLRTLYFFVIAETDDSRRHKEV